MRPSAHAHTCRNVHIYCTYFSPKALTYPLPSRVCPEVGPLPMSDSLRIGLVGSLSLCPLSLVIKLSYATLGPVCSYVGVLSNCVCARTFVWCILVSIQTTCKLSCYQSSSPCEPAFRLCIFLFLVFLPLSHHYFT
uniref:Ubiquitin-conjugating enzyme E2 8 n=1 Tax=Schistocephalus solidus TaxID=70667 RepID=A0A0V0JBZ1_SCHSO